MWGAQSGRRYQEDDVELHQRSCGAPYKEEEGGNRCLPFMRSRDPTIRNNTGRSGGGGGEGVSMGGHARHFFHNPSKAYTTGTRKRRKVQTDEHGSETRWHKTGKTRPIFVGGETKVHKKILVLYTTNDGRLIKKPQKTNWVMHQYHLGCEDEEREGELVVSKVFYQTQPRQCVSNKFIVSPRLRVNHPLMSGLIVCYDSIQRQ